MALIGKPQSEQRFCWRKNADAHSMNLLLPGSYLYRQSIGYSVYYIFIALENRCKEKVFGAASSIHLFISAVCFVLYTQYWKLKIQRWMKQSCDHEGACHITGKPDISRGKYISKYKGLHGGNP